NFRTYYFFLDVAFFHRLEYLNCVSVNSFAFVGACILGNVNISELETDVKRV
ncbi:hypothetical protein L9F63_007248, partial [Diploptera punctata]